MAKNYKASMTMSCKEYLEMKRHVTRAVSMLWEKIVKD